MSDMNEPDVDALILEYDIKIDRALIAKKEIALRIMKRKEEIRREEIHLTLQDKEIEKAKEELVKLREAHGK